MTKTTLMQMAEACGDEAWSSRVSLDHYAKEHPDSPLPPEHHWVKRAEALAGARVTLGLLAIDEEASRRFVASIIASHPEDARLWMSMQ